MSGLEKEKYNSEVQLTEDSQFNENIVNVPNFGTQKEEWNLERLNSVLFDMHQN